MTRLEANGKRMAKLESAIADMLLQDEARQGGVFEHISVLTVLLAKMLCAIADANSEADESKLLEMQDAALRDSVRLIRERERPASAKIR